MQGYFITAYRNLTSEMIDDLKADSARWEQERRNYNTGTSRQSAPARHDYATYRDNTASRYFDSPETSAGPAMPGAAQCQPLASYLDCAMATSTYDSPYYSIHSNPSIPAGQQAPHSHDPHEAQRIWPQIAASWSPDGTYALSAGLRDRIAANFNPRTREWLVARITAVLPDGNGPPSSEVAADTMLVLAL